ncbi:MAG: hypothetical protein DLM58_07500 [Pseudonocardiales bacterium]|nr:MAG: hypothetical protein DLM58_07500 [Pseudonocardiales bacterium]
MRDAISLIRVDIRIDGPWAVGGVGDLSSITSAIDLPVLRDPSAEGRAGAHLPATSLVGSLRRHLGGAGDQWLGPMPGGYEEVPDETRRVASPLQALGVRVTGAMIESVTSTAIDPHRRAARDGALRHEQYAESRTGVTNASWHLWYDGMLDESLLTALSTWRPFVGRRRTSGMGRAAVGVVYGAQLMIRQPAQLAWWLTGRDAWFDSAGDPADCLPEGVALLRHGPAAVTPQPAVIECRWSTTDPLHVGTGRRDAEVPKGDERATKPAPVRRDAAERPTVPGTAWKGIFRHRCDLILTACGIENRDAIMRRLFGAGGARMDGSDAARGVLRFQTSVVTGQVCPRRNHIAIDRITGGAAAGALFSFETVEGGTFGLRIESDARLTAAERRLLMHVIRDLDDGLIGVGAATTRGYGTVELADPGDRERLADPGPLTSADFAGRSA